MKHPEWPGAAIKNAFVSHHKRQRRKNPLRYHSYLPTRSMGPTPQCASNNARLLITEACRPGLHTAHAVSARKLGEDLPMGFVHCLASTGSSLKHSAQVLVLVIAEYFTDTEYTPLQSVRQGVVACCFFMQKAAQNNLVHPMVAVGYVHPAGITAGYLCRCAEKQRVPGTQTGDSGQQNFRPGDNISAENGKSCLHVAENMSIIK